MSTLRLRGLTLALGGRRIIEPLDLEVRSGEFLVLLGPSGCGKSTLLHGVAGLLRAEAGSVEIDGRDVTEAPPQARGIGMVFQSYALYPAMSVRGNLGFALRCAGTARAEIRRRVEHVADMLQITGLLERRPAQLSGGQRQRVAVGRALVREARLFLLDEPFSNLDAELRMTLRAELRELHQRLGATMILVTHDQADAQALAHRIALLRAGRIEQLGTPEALYERPVSRFAAEFIGAPKMMFRDGELAAGTEPGGLEFRAQGLRCKVERAVLGAATPAAGMAVTAGFRAEHVRLLEAHDETGAAARVVEVRSQGMFRLLRMQAESGTLWALCPPERPLQPGDALRYCIDGARLSVFSRSGARL